jgi:hypothetical protein
MPSECKLTELTGSPACAIEAGGGHDTRTASLGHVGRRASPQQMIVCWLIVGCRWV